MPAVEPNRSRSTYEPAWILEQMGLAPPGPVEAPAGPHVRVLFMPSFDPKVALEVEALPAGTRITLASYLTSLWYQRAHGNRIDSWVQGERPPALWLRRGVVTLDEAAREALREHVEAVVAERIDDPRRYVTIDGMSVWAGYRDGTGAVHDLRQMHVLTEHRARCALYRFMCAVARAAFLDEQSADLIIRVEHYLPTAP